MDKERAVIRFYIQRRKEEYDLDIPLTISATELVIALNQAYSLGINTADADKCYLKAEKPIALLRGSKTLAEYGIRNGSDIFFTE